MIACHCTGLSDRRIAAEVEAGASSLEEVTLACGAGGQCGGCHPLVEDIIDSGLTLSYLRRNLMARGPASLEVCSLLVRDTTDLDEIDVRHFGFTVPQKFVIGYGLDAAERFRNLPYIALYDGPVDH